MKPPAKQEQANTAPAKQFGNSGGLCLPLNCRAIVACIMFVLQVARNLAKARGPRARASRRVTTVGLRGARKIMAAAGEVRSGKVGGLIRRLLRL